MGRLIALFLVLCCLAYPVAGQQCGRFAADSNGGQRLITTIDFSAYRAIVAGELHNVPCLPAIKLAFITHMHEHYGTNHVFMEIGISAAWLYNQYLATGDTAFITSPVPVYGGGEGRVFWESLYRYNRACANKIVIHGLDFERLEFIKVLRLLRPAKTEPPGALKRVMQTVDTLTITSPNSPSLNTLYEQIRANFNSNEAEYRAYYGEHFSLVKRIMMNENTHRAYGGRDTNMFTTVQQQSSERGFGKFVVFVGQRHNDRSAPDKLTGMMAGVYGKTLLSMGMVADTRSFEDR
ncbi:MAG: hypothetical protein H7257_10635, partial [Taibaiella sp.]|nr:hypothetical protein [Taibaiella sp.]